MEGKSCALLERPASVLVTINPRSSVDLEDPEVKQREARLLREAQLQTAMEQARREELAGLCSSLLFTRTPLISASPTAVVQGQRLQRLDVEAGGQSGGGPKMKSARRKSSLEIVVTGLRAESCALHLEPPHPRRSSNACSPRRRHSSIEDLVSEKC